MTSKLEIANRALASIGARSTIANFEMEQSAEARQVRLIYEATRDALLRAAHWSFAKRTNYLTRLKSAPGTPENPNASGPWNPATMPALPWLYEYAYPSDCLLLRYVTPRPAPSNEVTPPIFSSGSVTAIPSPVTPTVPFVVASGTDTNSLPINVVNSNARDAIACYTLRVESEDLWDALFQEAMVNALASRLAVAVSGNLEVAQRAAAMANGSLVVARAQDANQGLTRVDHTPDWLLVRGVPVAANQQQFIAPWVQPAFLAI